MSDSRIETTAASHEDAADLHGRHRGPASSEEAPAAPHGRHRRTEGSGDDD
ncbi:hypothetical protein ACIP98_20670 [Streptomyces sp. NPDC088354]|uniref:hypothetical protein n=1 Tax=unclassified Streptomyces TaxID=2593676 RepID=UPI0029AD1B10|nr:hypothetical protein [Streptomyces sp. MI02-7b]MDX3075590.1 hypothetical protein [Streptomyces sp. MI02-7b]